MMGDKQERKVAGKESAALKAADRARAIARARKLLAEGMTVTEVARSMGRTAGFVSWLVKSGAA